MEDEIMVPQIVNPNETLTLLLASTTKKKKTKNKKYVQRYLLPRKFYLNSAVLLKLFLK